MKKKVHDSAAIKLLQLVWDHNQEAISHSWLKLNHSMHRALFLAVQSGMKFAKDDFETMHTRFRAGYWCGDLEYFYREAVLYRNASAWQAYENYRARTPFIWKDARLTVRTGDGPCGDGLARLVVGAEFTWKGEQVTVTRVKDGAEPAVIACSYSRTKEKICPRCKNIVEWPKEKILHRYSITHADLRTARAAMRVKRPATAAAA